MKDNVETTSSKEQAAKTQINKPQTDKPARRLWWTWLVVLLLPIVYYLPLWSEALQVELIGYEGFCCMPENWQELQRKAERARNMRLDSNLIIGTGIILAILALIGVIFVLYKYAIPSVKAKKLYSALRVIIGILIAPLAILLFLTLVMFVFDNNNYHQTRYQPPGDHIYGYAINILSWD